jgi:hypothetical protein
VAWIVCGCKCLGGEIVPFSSYANLLELAFVGVLLLIKDRIINLA